MLPILLLTWEIKLTRPIGINLLSRVSNKTQSGMNRIRNLLDFMNQSLLEKQSKTNLKLKHRLHSNALLRILVVVLIRYLFELLKGVFNSLHRSTKWNHCCLFDCHSSVCLINLLLSCLVCFLCVFYSRSSLSPFQ